MIPHKIVANYWKEPHPKVKSGKNCNPLENGTEVTSAHCNNKLPRRHHKNDQNLVAVAKKRHSNHSSALQAKTRPPTLRKPVQSRPVNYVSHSSVPSTPQTRPPNPKSAIDLGPATAHSNKNANPSSTPSPMKKRSRYTFRRTQIAPLSTIHRNSNGNQTPSFAHSTTATLPHLQPHPPSPIPPIT